MRNVYVDFGKDNLINKRQPKGNKIYFDGICYKGSFIKSGVKCRFLWSKDKDYGIRAEIQVNGEIEWSCDCHHAQFNDECKHRIACGSNNDSWSLLIKKELRLEYNERIDVLSADKDSDTMVSKIKIESDDD